jgi:hypothetical protein
VACDRVEDLEDAVLLRFGRCVAQTPGDLEWLLLRHAASGGLAAERNHCVRPALADFSGRKSVTRKISFYPLQLRAVRTMKRMCAFDPNASPYGPWL